MIADSSTSGSLSKVAASVADVVLGGSAGVSGRLRVRAQSRRSRVRERRHNGRTEGGQRAGRDGRLPFGHGLRPIARGTVSLVDGENGRFRARPVGARRNSRDRFDRRRSRRRTGRRNSWSRRPRVQREARRPCSRARHRAASRTSCPIASAVPVPVRFARVRARRRSRRASRVVGRRTAVACPIDDAAASAAPSAPTTSRQTSEPIARHRPHRSWRVAIGGVREGFCALRRDRLTTVREACRVRASPSTGSAVGTATPGRRLEGFIACARARGATARRHRVRSAGDDAGEVRAPDPASHPSCGRDRYRLPASSVDRCGRDPMKSSVSVRCGADEDRGVVPPLEAGTRLIAPRSFGRFVTWYGVSRRREALAGALAASAPPSARDQADEAGASSALRGGRRLDRPSVDMRFIRPRARAARSRPRRSIGSRARFRRRGRSCGEPSLSVFCRALVLEVLLVHGTVRAGTARIMRFRDLGNLISRRSPRGSR